MIQEYIIKKAIDSGLKNMNSFLEKKKTKLRQPIEDFQKAIQEHLTYVANWSKDVTFRDLRKPKDTERVYVELDYFLTARDYEIGIPQTKKKINLKKIFDEGENHIIILGQPGAGKTTTMKYLCQAVIFDEEFYPERFNFPILIRLRELSEDDKSYFSQDQSEFIFNRLFRILGFKLHDEDGISTNYSFSFIRESVLKIADELQLLIILDGFDEIVPLEKKDKILKEIKDLALNISTSTLILTSRTSDFPYVIQNMVDFEISPLSDYQIELFTEKYLEDEFESKDLYEKIKSSPFQIQL
jgi:predicted NACHT family NTPase